MLVDPAVLLRRVDDDQLACDAAGLGKESFALRRLEVPVEVPGEETVEGAVRERQREPVALHERRPGRRAARLFEHARALIERDDIAAQVLRQEAGAARDVERPARWQGGDRLRQLVELVVPAGPVTVGEAAATAVPVVVLRRARVVVLLHASSRV